MIKRIGGGAVISFVALRNLIQFDGGFDIRIASQISENRLQFVAVSKVLTPVDILVRNA